MRTILMTAPLVALMGLFVVAAGVPAYADPPGHKHSGKDRGGKDRGSSVSIDIVISDDDRIIVRDYYGGVAQSGRCPPGLAKKHNGCMPPGQAKKWQIGRPLPRDVIFYDVPRELRVRLSAPPQGYKYVRVAADVLMIAVGTGMVAAAIEDLARL